jgi:hypothetical protein
MNREAEVRKVIEDLTARNGALQAQYDNMNAKLQESANQLKVGRNYVAYLKALLDQKVPDWRYEPEAKTPKPE